MLLAVAYRPAQVPTALSAQLTAQAPEATTIITLGPLMYGESPFVVWLFLGNESCFPKLLEHAVDLLSGCGSSQPSGRGR